MTRASYDGGEPRGPGPGMGEGEKRLLRDKTPQHGLKDEV